MYFRAILRIIGLLIVLFSITMIIPAIISFIYQDQEGHIFIKIFFIILIVGLSLWVPNNKIKYQLKPKDACLIVTLFWIVLGTIGSLPFALSNNLNLNITDSCFESFSGLTTTGATNLINLDLLPKSILFYRQMLQWLGGMGIIVLAVTILPLLGIGEGIQLYRAEVSRTIKKNKMLPRIAETAKILWLIYVLLTIVCTFILWIVGMDLFDAITHSFSTISIGGFSTHDKNIGYFNSPIINIVISIFLIISGSNFTLHFLLLSGEKMKIYWNDPEFRFFIIFQLILIIITTIILAYYSVYNSILESLNHALFQVISLTTTAGFSTEQFSNWPLFLPTLLLSSSFIGGCAGSTGGGMKVIRILLLFLQSSIELKRIVHPNAIYTIKLGDKAIPKQTTEAIWSFFSAYCLIFFISFILLIGTGIDEFSSFSSVIATLNNLGPGLGSVAENFSHINPIGKWILIIIMLLGRLEIFTLLVLFTSTFWKK
ncbi:MAG: TrkH family potassium uptake protein [Arsenophonus sp.]|nr:MAG: TrkH family potassium uptake protein [Arsenophonus sp.]